MIDAKALEAAKEAAKDTIRVDATGLVPAIASAYVVGIPEAIEAAITAYLAAERERGFVMVPVEPDDNMIDAGADQMCNPSGLVRAYRAMIAAAKEGE